MSQILEFESIRAVLGQPNPSIGRKIKPQLNARMCEFVERSPLLMVATMDEHGFPTVSPKGDDPGFVKIVDANTLLIPERKGNRLAFSFRHMLAHPKVGLIFIVPGTSETLRIHGQCRILNDPAMCAELSSATQKALLVTEVKVESCYFHCGKAFLRSGAWNPDAWTEPMSISFGEEMFGSSADAEASVRELDEGVKSRYTTDL